MNLNAITNNRLYFSNPLKFNDPYDNLLFANTSMIINEIIGSIVLGMNDYLRTRKGLIPGPDLVEKIWNDNKSREAILNEHINIILSALDAIRLNLKKNARIICFSECYDSMLMWSHYAGNHSGFELVYDKNDLEKARKYDCDDCEIKSKTQLLPVQYVDRQTDMTEWAKEYIRHNMLANMGDVETIDASIPTEMIKIVISEKAKEWSYEKEWRLIPDSPSIEIESDLSYIVCRPLAVIIGSQCQGKDRKKLIKICRCESIPIYGIFLSETNPEFKLIVNDDGNTEIASDKYFFEHI